jgi:hypothetical protein
MFSGQDIAPRSLLPGQRAEIIRDQQKPTAHTKGRTVKPTPEREQLLADLAQKILDAFESIAQAARGALGQASGYVDELLPVNAQQHLQQMRSETRISLSRLLREPAIVRVEVRWQDRNATDRIYVCRGLSAGMTHQERTGRSCRDQNAIVPWQR